MGGSRKSKAQVKLESKERNKVNYGLTKRYRGIVEK